MTLGNFQKQLLLLLTEAETAKPSNHFIYMYNYYIYDSCQGSTFAKVTVGKITFLSATEL